MAQDYLHVDRTPKACPHGGRHKHGTPQAYNLDDCRCLPCAFADSERRTRLHREHAMGRFNRLVDAEPVRKHVNELRARGMGWKQIAREADVEASVVSRLLYGSVVRGKQYGPSKRMRPEKAEKLLAVQFGRPAVYRSVGTARRLQALMVNGWTMRELACRIGMEPGAFGPVVHGDRMVSRRTREAVERIYDELWDQAPPRRTPAEKLAYTRSVRYAASRKWAPTLAWDDNTIDDPDAKPDLGERSKRPGGHQLVDEVIENIEWIMDAEPYATAQRIAERLGDKRDTLLERLRRAERADLLERLERNRELSEHAA